MKKLSIFSLLLFGIMTFAQGIQFENSNFGTILAKAKKENKLIFLDAYTSWCGPCKLMAKNIFPLPSVGDYYNSHFINAKIDMEKGEGIDLAKKYTVKAFPTYLFINGDGEEVHRTLGYVEENDFIQFAKDAEDPTKTLSSLKQRFENGEKEPEFLKNLIGLTLYNDAAFSNRVITRYLAQKTDLDQEDIQILLMSINTTEDSLYQLFKEKKNDIQKLLSPEQYDLFDKNIKINTAVKHAYNTERKTWNDKIFMDEANLFLTKEEADTFLKKAKAVTALRNKDIAVYEKLSLELYNSPSLMNSEELNAVAWNFFENVNTKSSLQKAILWAQESVKKNENYANTDTLANLYKKIGDKKNAKHWAEKSITLAKTAGQDSSDTEKLLQSL